MGFLFLQFRLFFSQVRHFRRGTTESPSSSPRVRGKASPQEKKRGALLLWPDTQGPFRTTINTKNKPRISLIGVYLSLYCLYRNMHPNKAPCGSSVMASGRGARQTYACHESECSLCIGNTLRVNVRTVRVIRRKPKRSSRLRPGGYNRSPQWCIGIGYPRMPLFVALILEMWFHLVGSSWKVFVKKEI